ncbi:MAG: hypothetical protein H7327_07560 [Herminiimonas sp.]|nr:hypothetical protein [Herminiimonas sp.]
MNAGILKLMARCAGQFFLSAALVVSVSACGGGGGSAGGSGATTTTGTGTTSGNSVVAGVVKLVLVDAQGAPSRALTLAGPITAQATVVDSKGAAVANTIVTFATGGTLSTLSPASGSVLTNAAGVASVNLTPKDLLTAQTQAGAADTVTATATVATQPLKATANYQLGVTSVSLKLAAPSAGTVSLKSYGTTSIKVDVLANGAPYIAQPVTVNFSSNCAGAGKATLPASATTLNGQAQVVYVDKGCSGTDVVTVSLTGAQPITASLVVAPPVAASIGFVSATPSDKAIVLQGSGGNGRVETATLTFKALDTSGQPLANQSINFTVNPAGVVSLPATTAITGVDGTVVVTVNSGTVASTFRVIATFADQPLISTISDTVTVTTGQPIQAAFSLSVETFNISGWDHDNVQTKVNILLADANGNPVADGTPVVFSTDSGAIGSSSIGGCVTTNGACFVVYRSQNPRYGLNNTAGKAPGVATITVSTTSALYKLDGTTTVILSMDQPVPQAPQALVTTSCQPYSLQITPKDANGNPLPATTAITAANVVGKTTIGEIIPSAVPITRVAIPHTIPVIPPGTCKEGGATTVTDSFDIKIATPLGVPVQYHYTFTYPSP